MDRAYAILQLLILDLVRREIEVFDMFDGEWRRGKMRGGIQILLKERKGICRRFHGDRGGELRQEGQESVLEDGEDEVRMGEFRKLLMLMRIALKQLLDLWQY